MEVISIGSRAWKWQALQRRSSSHVASSGLSRVFSAYGFQTFWSTGVMEEPGTAVLMELMELLLLMWRSGVVKWNNGCWWSC